MFTRWQINYQFHSVSWPFFFFRWMYNETIIWFGFCDIQNNQGLGKGYQPQPQPQPSASADNRHLDLDYSGYHKNLIQQFFNIAQDNSVSSTCFYSKSRKYETAGHYLHTITRVLSGCRNLHSECKATTSCWSGTREHSMNRILCTDWLKILEVR